MKILVIDRDELVAQMMTTRLEEDGHEVVVETSKSEALELVANQAFDVIFADPSPMKDVRAMALNIRRSSKVRPYIIFMTSDEEITLSDSIQMGCNSLIYKPLDPEHIKTKINNAERLKDFFDNLADTSKDFPSAGGVIAKSAYNQLCLSAMDRGGRYNELTYILSIAVENYDEIKRLDGDYNASYSVSKMAYHMVRLRRLSDVVGQTRENEYSILLQRTEDEKEALDAASRFVATFDEIDDFLPSDGNPITIRLSLIRLPTGACPFDHSLSKKIQIPSE